MISSKNYYKDIKDIERKQNDCLSVLDSNYKHSPIYILKDSKIDYASYITRYPHSLFGTLHIISQIPMQIENVYQYYLFKKSSITGITPIFQNSHVLEVNDMLDFYVVCSHPVITQPQYTGMDEIISCDMCIYHIGSLSCTVKNVQRIDKIGVDLKIIYTSEPYENTYKHWIYKNGLTELILEDKLSWTSKSQNELLIKRNYAEILQKDDIVEIVFNDSLRKNCLVLKEFAKTAKTFDIIQNIFSDDDSINYKIGIYKNNILDIAFAKYCIDCDISTGSFLIYGVSLEYLTKFCQTKPSPQKALNEISKLNLTIEQEMYYQQLANTVFNAIKSTSYFSDVSEYINRTGTEQSEAILLFLKSQNFEYISHISEFKERYNNYYSMLVENGDVIPKWKSEYSLYELIKKKYPNAIYQYRAKWLGHQSLDIFIPDKMIGIEYQGIQHYKPISLFGGLAHFQKQQSLDIQKKKLCEENNIFLVEWRYDEPISSAMLKQKISEN